MALPEIEAGEYEFRAVYITSDDQLEVEYFDYTLDNAETLKRRLDYIKRFLLNDRYSKEVRSITYKRLL